MADPQPGQAAPIDLSGGFQPKGIDLSGGFQAKPDTGVNTQGQPGFISRAWDWANRGLISGKTLVNAAGAMIPRPADMKEGESTYDYLTRMQDKIDPDHPYMSALRTGMAGVTKDVYDTASSMGTSPLAIATFGAGPLIESLFKGAQGTRATINAAKALRTAHVAAGVGFGGQGLHEAYEAATDPNKSALEKTAGISGGLGQAILGGVGAGESYKGSFAPTGVDALNRGIQAGKGLIDPLSNMTPAEIMSRGTKPRNQLRDITPKIEQALPHARAAADQLGIDINTMGHDEALAATRKAKQNVWNTLEQNHLGPASSFVRDTTPVADRIQAVADGMSDIAKGRNRPLVDSIDNAANDYRGQQMSVADMEQRIEELNNELYAEQSRLKVQQDTLKRDPSYGYKFAELEGLRGALNEALDQITGPGAAELKKTYGSLKAMEDILDRSRNVAERPSPVGLFGGLGKMAGVGNLAGGVWQTVTGHPETGLPQIAKGGAQAWYGSKAAQLNNRNYLVGEAFRRTTPAGAPPAPSPIAQAAAGFGSIPPANPANVPPWTGAGQAPIQFTGGTNVPAQATPPVPPSATPTEPPTPNLPLFRQAQVQPAAPGAPPVEMPGVSPEGVQAFQEGARQTPAPSENVAPEVPKAPEQAPKTYTSTPERKAARNAATAEAVSQLRKGNVDRATYDEIRNRSYTPELEPEHLHGISQSPDRKGESGLDTREASQVNGEYTPERKQMHKDRELQVLGPDKGPEENPVVIFQGGGAASGKTESLGKEMEAKYPGIRTIDADVLKNGDEKKGIEGLPEAKYLRESDPLGAAARMHEESSDLSKQIQNEALRRKQSVIIDTVGSNAKKMMRTMQEFKDRGYRVEVHYVDKDFAAAAKSMANRFEKPFTKTGEWGRWVPPHVAEPAHRGAAAAYHAIAESGIPDEHSLRMANAKGAEDVTRTTYTTVHKDGKITDDVLYRKHREKGGLDNGGHGRELDRGGLQETARVGTGGGPSSEVVPGEPGTVGAGEESPRGTAEAAKEVAPPSEPTLPGMEHIPAERAQAAAEEQGRQMTEQMTEPPRSVESAAGEMERNSPLFRGSEASPQNEMFAPGGAAPEPDEIGRPSQVRLVKTADLHADPKRFQWRAVPRATIPEGAAWDQAKAGPIDVWRDPADGKLYIVDGHHRLNHAINTGTPEVEVRAHDFANAQEAKTYGALRNLEQGNASPFDAALYLRESGIKPQHLAERGINLTGDVLRKGSTLANLSPEMWEQYRTGQIDEAKAAAIGSLDDPAQQKALAEVAKNRRLSAADLQQQARRIQQQGNTSHSEMGLFGPSETSVSNAIATGRLSTKIERALAADKNALKFIANADQARRVALERGKNIVNVEESSQEAMISAALAEHYQKVQYKSGPVGRILEDAGKRITQGENADTVFKEIYPQIRDAVASEIGQR